MRRQVIWIAPVLMALTAVCYASIPTRHYTLTVKSKEGTTGVLCCEKGKLVLGTPSKRKDTRDIEGRRDVKDTPDGWFVLGTKIKSSVGGGYLAYDPAGKDSRIRLTPRADDEGTDWNFQKFLPSSVRGPGERGTLQAASGPLKDQYLDVSVCDITREDGTTIRTLCFVLSKDRVGFIEVVQIVIGL